MFFKIKKKEIIQKLNYLQKNLNNKNENKLLSAIKIKVLEKKIFFSSFSENLSIKTLVKKEINIFETGEVLIYGKYLLDIIKKISVSELIFKLAEENILIIKAGETEFKLKTLDISLFEKIIFLKEGKKEKFFLTIENILSATKKTLVSAANHDFREILNGINLKVKDNCLITLTTDSFRLSQKKFF